MCEVGTHDRSFCYFLCRDCIKLTAHIKVIMAGYKMGFSVCVNIMNQTVLVDFSIMLSHVLKMAVTTPPQ